MRVLSRDEQQRFVAHLLNDMDECKFGTLLSLFTGIRIGELCALQWGNISFDDNTIRISSTMQRLQNTESDAETKTKIIIGTPKSDTSLRTIPLTEQAAELCGRMNPQSKAAYVLTGTDKYMEPRTLQYRLEKKENSPCRRFRLVVNNIVIYNFGGSATDVIHPSNPLHLILCLKLFSNVLTLCHLFYELKKHILSMLVNISKVAV